MFKHYSPILTVLFLLALLAGSFAIYKSFFQPTPPAQLALASPTPPSSPSPTSVPTQILGASESTSPTLELEITSPEPNASVSASLLAIVGKTATDAAVKINDKLTPQVDVEGNFKSSFRLVQGANLLIIEASSSAGRNVWQTVVTYTPKQATPPAQTPTNVP